MSKIIYATWFAFSLLLLPACKSPPEPDGGECGRGIRNLAGVSPRERAEISFRSGAPKFLAFRGLPMKFPGSTILPLSNG